MRIAYKTKEQLAIMKKGGALMKKIFDNLSPKINEGIMTCEIDAYVEKLIADGGATASFKTVSGYTHATCISVNQQVVHTPPSRYILRVGDIVTVDIGVYLEGFHTDSAHTYFVGIDVPIRISRFLSAGEKTLTRAINAVREGNRVGHISNEIEKGIKEAGYYIVHQLTGHGVGRKLHEAPSIPGVGVEKIRNTPILKNGMTLAIEVIYGMGTGDIEQEEDGWSLVTADGSLSACFEKTLAVDEGNRVVLT